MPRENLDLVTEIYTHDPFERENTITDLGYVTRCIEYADDRSSWLELGLGRGVVLRHLSDAFQKVQVLDGSPFQVAKYSGLYPNVEISLTFFEDFETTARFKSIGMGFILEHVDDPVVILNRFRKLLSADGALYVAVPSASSMHRLLAVRAGLLDDLRTMSDTDRRFGHKRYFTYDDWMELFRQEGFRVRRSEGLYLKPFATGQLASLELDSKVYEALGSLAHELPQMSNACFFLLTNE